MRDKDLHSSTREDISLWLDFYGQLLTSHTRDVLELHYSEDMSLSEIAEHLGITRQAVHDRIRQGAASLVDYETKLGLAERFRNQKTCVQEALEALAAGQAEAARDKLMQLNGLL